MGKKKNLLTDLMYNLQGLNPMSNDDMGQTYGGNSNRVQDDDDTDDGNIGADVPL